MKKNFGFLIFDDYEELDLIGPWEMIGIWSKQFDGPENVFTISQFGQIIKGSKDLRIASDYSLENCPLLDYILIPGGMGTRVEANNPVMIDFVRQKTKNCQMITSVCTGAFLLQAAGLLAGKKATTHWLSLDRLRAFSDVMVCEQRFVRDGNIWTSAGVSAGIDMALALIADVSGDNIAAEVQCYAEYFPSQNNYITKEQINRLPEYARQNLKSIK